MMHTHCCLCEAQIQCTGHLHQLTVHSALQRFSAQCTLHQWTVDSAHCTDVYSTPSSVDSGGMGRRESRDYAAKSDLHWSCQQRNTMSVMLKPNVPPCRNYKLHKKNSRADKVMVSIFCYSAHVYDNDWLFHNLKCYIIVRIFSICLHHILRWPELSFKRFWIEIW